MGAMSGLYLVQDSVGVLEVGVSGFVDITVVKLEWCTLVQASPRHLCI